MDPMNMDGIWELSEVLKTDKKDRGSVPATVSRIDQEGTIWVQMVGSSEETPINGMAIANVKPGDNVRIDIGNNAANLIGNSSSPAIGEREVLGITEPIKNAVSTAQAAASNALQIAQEAAEIAGDTSNHFWNDSYGAHVADVEEDAWNAAVADEFSDYNETTKPYRNILVGRLGILLRSCLNNLVSVSRSAIAFFDGLGNSASNIVASFGSSGAVIGYESDTHVSIDSDSLDINDGNTLLATFDAEGARIGANSQQAEISFCNGLGLVRNDDGMLEVFGTEGALLTSSKMGFSGSDRNSAYGGAAVQPSDYDATMDAISVTTSISAGVNGESSAIGEEYWSDATVACYTERVGANINPQIVATVTASDASDDDIHNLKFNSLGLNLLTKIHPTSNPSETIWTEVVGWRNSADTNWISYLQPSQATNGTQSLSIGVRTLSGSNVRTHAFGISVAKDGTASVSLNQTAWLNALGLTTTSWAYLYGSSSSTDKYVRWRAVAGVVYVEWYYTTGAGISAGSYAGFGTIPSGYRPSKHVSGACYGTGNNVLWWEILTSGAIHVGTKASSASDKAYGTASYPLG